MSTESKPFETSKSATHLKSYPIVNDLVNVFAASALISSLYATVQPVISYFENLILSVAFFKAILSRIDELFNGVVLDRLDSVAPSVKQVHLQDVSLKSLTGRAYSNLNEFNSKVKSYEQQIRPTVSEKVDPLIKPLNNKLEGLIENFLPKQPPTSATSNPDELARFYNLTTSAYRKTIPAASQELSSYSSHVTEKYSANLTPESKTVDKLQAAAKTSYELSNEGLQYLNKTYETSVKPKVDPYLTKINSSKSHTADILEDTKNQVDALVNEAVEAVH